jgi:hypothetical protein
MTRTERKYRRIQRRCSDDEILLIYRNGESGGGFMNLDAGLLESADFLMERSDGIKDFILEAARRYLEKYEIQKQEFIKKLYNKD